MRAKHAIFKTLICMAIAIAFNVGLLFVKGQAVAVEFLGGYIMELSLSVDNLFLFLMIFKSFNIDPKYQGKILTYGIAGAIILRFVFIFFGVAIVNRFQWVTYIFGIMLLISSVKMLLDASRKGEYKESGFMKIITKFMPVAENENSEKFFVIKNKRLHMTKLFLVLLIIEGSDIVFAMDSIPSVFSITTNPFVVYTSNIFALVGLRSMYYLLERLNCMFRFMKYGVALLLMFAGVKLVGIYFGIHIPTIISVLVIIIILLSSILISLIVDEFHCYRDRIKKRVA